MLKTVDHLDPCPCAVVEAVPGSDGAAAAMGRLGLGSQPPVQVPQAGGKRYRFVRLPGVQASDLEDLSPAQLSRLVAGQLAEAVAAEPAARGASEPAAATSSSGREEDRPGSAGPRMHWYQQVSGPASQGAPPSRHPAVLDLVRHAPGEGPGGGGDEGFVTDVYATVESEGEDGDIAAAWEAHLAGRAPVVQVSVAAGGC